MKKIKKIILISIIGIIIDRVTKILITNNIKENNFYKIIGNFFRITNAHNKGAAWSTFENKTIFLIILSILFLIFLINCIKKDKRNTKLNIIGYSFMIAGIIGNLIDRIIYKYVIDFIAVKIINYHFPIFNIADSLIVIGVLIFIIDMIQEGKETSPVLQEYKEIKEKISEKDSSRRK